MTTARFEKLRPVNRESTASIIASQLQQAIMDGVLPAGSRMAEAELAAQLGVSRGPLREAMQRLVQQGLLRSEPHRGLFVITLDDDSIRDIYMARTAIETAACRLVLSGDPNTAVRQLAPIIRSMTQAAARADWAAITIADMEFHQTLLEASESPRLTRMAEALLVETRMCMAALRDMYSAPLDMSAEHAAIVEAIRRRDEPTLLALVEGHMDDAIERLTGHNEPAADIQDGER